MKHTEHAREIADRFRELVEAAGDSLPANHYGELALLIEAGIDTTLVESLEKIADKMDGFSHAIRQNAEFFD